MLCPECSAELKAPASKCPICGCAFTNEFAEAAKARAGLESGIARLRLIEDNLRIGLEDVSKRLSEYDRLVSLIPAKKAPKPSPSPKPAPAGLPSPQGAKETPVEIRPPASAPSAQSASGFELALGLKGLLIIGIITMVFGVGYFLKYSFERGWIGPAARVALAYFWGMALLAAGDIACRRQYPKFGLPLAGGGIAVLYFASFAAFNIYHLMGQSTAFSLMALTTAFAVTLAVFYDTIGLAALGLAGGFLTPAFLSTGVDNQTFLMTYMAILNMGILGIAFYKRWDLLNALGLAFTYIVFAGWVGKFYSVAKFVPTEVFLNVFFLIYVIVPFLSRYTRREDSDSNADYVVMGANSIIAFGFSYYFIADKYPSKWAGAVSASYALIYLALAGLIRSRQDAQEEESSERSFVFFASCAALFLMITVPIVFSKHWITLFWCALAVTSLWAGFKSGSRTITAISYILLGTACFKFLFHDYPTVFKLFYSLRSDPFTYMLAERLITTAFALGAVFAFGLVSSREEFALMLRKGRSDSAIFYAGFGALLFICLNVEVSAFFKQYASKARFAAISVLWTAFSVSTMLLGFRRNSGALRSIALGLFGITLLKVFLLDMSNIHTPYRILSFIILGVVMIGTSYLYHRYKGRLIEALGGEFEEKP